MASSYETKINIFDEERARETVIDYVQTHPGCSKEEIWTVKENKIGKKKLNRILPDLIEEGIIEEGEPIGRKRPLFVNRANPYTEVVTELKKFEKIYFSILDKTVSARNNRGYLRDWSKTKIKSYYFDDSLVEKKSDDLDEFLVESSYAMYLALQPMDIFYGFLNIYMVRLVTNWSKEIRNKHVLNKINNMIFAKFALMQKHMNKIIASISSIESIRLSYSQMQMDTMDKLKETLTNLKLYNMEEEVNQLSKFIDGVLLNEELRSYFRHKRGSLYRWDSKYKKEDKEALAEDVARHPDWLDDYSS